MDQSGVKRWRCNGMTCDTYCASTSLFTDYQFVVVSVLISVSIITITSSSSSSSSRSSSTSSSSSTTITTTTCLDGWEWDQQNK